MAELEERCGEELPITSPWWCWAVRHSAWLYNRFHKKAVNGGLTPYEKYKHRRYAQPILQLAAAVWARRPGAALNKAGAPLIAGLWLGRDSATDEHVVATGAGVFRTRTVKRKPLEIEWDKQSACSGCPGTRAGTSEDVDPNSILIVSRSWQHLYPPTLLTTHSRSVALGLRKEAQQPQQQRQQQQGLRKEAGQHQHQESRETMLDDRWQAHRRGRAE